MSPSAGQFVLKDDGAFGLNADGSFAVYDASAECAACCGGDDACCLTGYWYAHAVDESFTEGELSSSNIECSISWVGSETQNVGAPSNVATFDVNTTLSESHLVEPTDLVLDGDCIESWRANLTRDAVFERVDGVLFNVNPAAFDITFNAIPEVGATGKRRVFEVGVTFGTGTAMVFGFGFKPDSCEMLDLVSYGIGTYEILSLNSDTPTTASGFSKTMSVTMTSPWSFTVSLSWSSTAADIEAEHEITFDFSLIDSADDPIEPVVCADTVDPIVASEGC